MQWQNICQIRTAFGNHEQIGGNTISFVNRNKGSVQRLQTGHTSSYWFNHFAQGNQTQMGAIVKKDLAVDVKVIVKVPETCANKIVVMEDIAIRGAWVIAGAYMDFLYVFGFCGNKGFMIDIEQMLLNQTTWKDLVWITVSGKVKNDNAPAIYKFCSITKTGSGINVQA